jgi:hypothetical protein
MNVSDAGYFRAGARQFRDRYFPPWAAARALDSGEIAARPITAKGFPLTWHAVYLNHSNIPIYQQEVIRSIRRQSVTVHRYTSKDSIPRICTRSFSVPGSFQQALKL